MGGKGATGTQYHYHRCLCLSALSALSASLLSLGALYYTVAIYIEANFVLSYVLLCMCAVCYIFVFVLLAETKTGSVHSAKGSETFWEGHTER